MNQCELYDTPPCVFVRKAVRASSILPTSVQPQPSATACVTQQGQKGERRQRCTHTGPTPSPGQSVSAASWGGLRCVHVWGEGWVGWRRDLEAYTVITKLEWPARPCAHTRGTIAGLMLFVCPSSSVQRVKIAVIRCCVLQVLYKQRVKIAMISFFPPFVSFCFSLYTAKASTGTGTDLG